MEQAELSSFSFNTPTRQGNARRRERRKWVGLAVMIIFAMLPGSFLLPAPAPAWTPPAAQRLNLRGQSSINFEVTGFVDSNQTASWLLNPLLAHAMGEGHRPRFRHLPAADEPFSLSDGFLRYGPSCSREWFTHGSQRQDVSRSLARATT